MRNSSGRTSDERKDVQLEPRRKLANFICNVILQNTNNNILPSENKNMNLEAASILFNVICSFGHPSHSHRLSCPSAEYWENGTEHGIIKFHIYGLFYYEAGRLLFLITLCTIGILI